MRESGFVLCPFSDTAHWSVFVSSLTVKPGKARPNIATLNRSVLGRPGLLAALHSSLPPFVLLKFDPNQRGLFWRGNGNLCRPIQKLDRVDTEQPAMWRET
jgi:hypothetical protein